MKAFLIYFFLPLTFVQRKLMRLSRLWSFCQFQVALKRPLDPSIVVLGCPDVFGTANIWLDQGLFLYRHIHLETQAMGKIEIGKNVVISRGVHIVAFDQVCIGNGSMIGEFTSIRDANHQFFEGDSTPDKTRGLRDAGHIARPIWIGEQVWIGRGVILLPGVKVGDRAVIGANAVVTKDVAANSVVAGNPARFIKFTQSMEAI